MTTTVARITRLLLLSTVVACSSSEDPGGDGAAVVVPDTDRGSGPAAITSYAFHSSTLANNRTIWVYTPPGYDSGQRYPVLYMQDGAEVFATASANPVATWKADQAASQLINAGTIAPLIIVAVGTPDRNAEYTPTFDSHVSGSGRGPLYARMLVQELKPFVDAHFRTRTDPASTGIGGGSYGGLIAVYTALHYPGTFGLSDGTSASLWWANQLVTAQLSALPSKVPVRFWLDRGADEVSEDTAEVDGLAVFATAAVAKGWTDGLDVRYEQGFPGGHDVGSWAQRFGPMLQFLFPR